MAEYEAAVRQAQRSRRLEEAEQVNAAFEHHVHAHEQQFDPIQKPIITPEKIDVGERIRAAERKAIEGISVVHPARRREARDTARATAIAQAEADQRAANEAAASRQAAVDATWSRLVANDPETVLNMIEAVYADNEAPAAPLDCHDDTVSLLMRFPPIDGFMPTERPDVTPTGRPTVRAWTQTERNGVYAAAIASHSYATVAEAFAIAPGIRHATLVVILTDDTQVTPVYIAAVDRHDLEAGAWESDGYAIAGPGSLINYKGRTRVVSALDLSQEPEVSALVKRVAGDLGLRLDPTCRTAHTSSNSDPGIAPGATEPDATDFEMPARVTQPWLERTVPGLVPKDLDRLVQALRTRSWTDDEIEDRVLRLRTGS